MTKDWFVCTLKNIDSSLGTVLLSALRSLLCAALLCTLSLGAVASPDAFTPDGGRYYGPLVNGRMEGKGRLESRLGTYAGDFKQGLYEGQGQYTDKRGNRYDGAFLGGSFHGKGRYKNVNGDTYEGGFIDGNFEGQGVSVLANKSRFEGRFKNWVPDGPGVYTDHRGTVYEGHFSRGMLKGAGKMRSRDGTEYEGDFVNQTFHGKGKLKLAGGDVYSGNFAFGEYHGEGTLQYAKPRADGRTQESGNWEYGSLEDKSGAGRAVANVEIALYNQQAMLNKAIGALQPADPKKIELFLLAVGGDGEQEVFRREVDYAQNQFDRDYGTRGHSLVLVNSRSTVERSPLATRTSIREALRALGARMDKEQDILFLFLTSHGSGDHKLSLQHERMDFPDLPAKELATMVEETGIRHRVVLVSACYAGGFIPHLKNDHTMVITAARHDRTSFGCEDENDFTHFGRAFFQEALPQSTSFIDAFTKAAKLVDEWEKKEKVDNHSLPQMHSAKPIEEQLRRWRESQNALKKP
jgi:hypothetical protein